MDPCPFVRIVVGNLALRFPANSPLPVNSAAYYCKFKLKGLPTQVSDDIPAIADNETIESRNHACFALRRSELEKLAEKSRNSVTTLHVEIRRSRNGCGGGGGKLVGRVAVPLDLKNILENNLRASIVQNGWVMISRSDLKLHFSVRTEPDPRFVFRFDGEPECSPQVFQVNGNVKQPVFTCKFSIRHSAERVMRSRSSSPMETVTSAGCFGSGTSGDGEQALKERKGWSVTIHDLSGSPVALASMVTPFVPSPGTDTVSRSNPGAWLILRPGHSTWRPWGRLEAWRERGDRIGYRFDLIPDGGVSDTIPLANSSVSAKSGGKLSIDVTTGPTPVTSPNSSFDLGSGSGSGSDLGSASGSGSWAHLLYRGFVMSSTVDGGGRRSRPEVEVGVQHVACAEDAAAFVALAAAMDLSLDACTSFSKKLRKELRQPDLV